MFWLFLGGGYPKTRNFHCLVICWWRVTEESRREHGQDSYLIAWVTWSDQVWIPYHRRSCSVYELGELAGRWMIIVKGWSGCWSAYGEKLCWAPLVSLWFCHFHPLFIFLLLYCTTIVIIISIFMIIIFCFNYVIALISAHEVYLFFLILQPTGIRGGR